MASEADGRKYRLGVTNPDRVYQLTKQELQNIEQIIEATPANVLGSLESSDPTRLRLAIRFVERMDKDAAKIVADLRAYQEKAHRDASHVQRMLYICRMHNIFITDADLDSDGPVPRDSMRLETWPPASIGTKMRRRGGRNKWTLGDDGKWQPTAPPNNPDAADAKPPPRPHATKDRAGFGDFLAFATGGPLTNRDVGDENDARAKAAAGIR